MSLNKKITLKKLFLISSGSLISLSLVGCAPLVVAGAGGAAVGATTGGNSIPVETQVSDVQIKLAAIDLLKDYPQLKQNSNVEIIVFDQTVLLLGQVPTDEIKTNLAQKIASLAGVRLVYDQLTVGPRVSIGTYATDSLITTSVISSLVANGINSLKYKVVTESGVVYMMGSVTHQEAKEASNVASGVSGVTKVIEAYSIIPDQSQNESTSNVTADNNNQIDNSSYETNTNIDNKPLINEQTHSAIGPTGPV